jgi:hypothetical protein
MDSFSSLIVTLGGPTEVAGALDMKAAAIQKMKDRDNIKPKHWPAFVKLARKRGVKGVSLEALLHLSLKRAA